MRVIKAAYRMGRRGGLASLRGSLQYATQRPDREGQQADRGPFGRSGALERDEASAVLASRDDGGGCYYRLVLNPGEGASPREDLQTWTRDVMHELERRQGQEVPWVAVIHDDHSAHAHVHVMAVTDQRLNTLDLQALRDEADRAWTHQQQLIQVRERDLADDMFTRTPEKARGQDLEQEIG